MDTKKLLGHGALQFITFWAFTCRKWAHGDLEIKTNIFSYDLSRFYFWELRVPLLVGPWAGMSRNRARSRARKHARDHRLPRAINYGAVCMESLNIDRGSTIRREIACMIALGTQKLKQNNQILFQCHIFMLFVQILFLGSWRAFTSWPMGLRLGLRSRLRFRLWVLHPHGLHRRPTARCACLFLILG